jgi:hypothetical protein
LIPSVIFKIAKELITLLKLSKMKKTLFYSLSLCLIFLSLNSFSQPTLTASGIIPTLGQTFSGKTSNTSIVEGNAGANQTWNFSTMVGTTTVQTTIVAPSTTSQAASFPSSNIAYNYPTENSVLYFKNSGTALQFYGAFTGGINIVYSDPEDQMRFPLHYNNSYTDTWKAQYLNQGYLFYRSGTSTITYDGYGTLTTPNGVYTNVTRVHLVQNYKDSTNTMGTPFIINSSNDEYFWYKEGIHYQLAYSYDLTSNGQGVSSSGYLLGSVGIEDNLSENKNINVFPNPVIGDVMNISLSNIDNQELDIQMYNALGQQVILSQNIYKLEAYESIQLDVSDLKEGIYFVKVKLQDESILTKQVIVVK